MLFFASSPHANIIFINISKEKVGITAIQNKALARHIESSGSEGREKFHEPKWTAPKNIGMNRISHDL